MSCMQTMIRLHEMFILTLFYLRETKHDILLHQQLYSSVQNIILNILYCEVTFMLILKLNKNHLLTSTRIEWSFIY